MNGEHLRRAPRGHFSECSHIVDGIYWDRRGWRVREAGQVVFATSDCQTMRLYMEQVMPLKPATQGKARA